MHTASSLHNQGNGFSFRHLTLLSKENPSCLVVLWTEVALSSVPDPSKSLMGTGMGTDRGPPPLPMPRCPRPDGTAGGGCSREQHPKRHPSLSPHGSRVSLGRARRTGEWDVAGACQSGPQSVLSIHGVQIFGFNDSGQQVVAGRRENRPQGEHRVREQEAGGRGPPPPPPPPGPLGASRTGWGSWRS